MKLLLSLVLLLSQNSSAISAEDGVSPLFAKDNLVAWCIVPFDSKQRGPAERAEMLTQLGIYHVAYDWRAKHVPTFEDEILQYKKHHLNFFAFWSWHPAMEPLIQKHGIRPQIWITNPSPAADTQVARLEAAAQSLLPLVKKTKQLNLKLGLYNHGGWGGQPANLVAVCEHLHKQYQADQVGIVYNFHHGHEHIEDFSDSLATMLPYLICLNLNGMADPDVVATGKDKILPIGSGIHEKQMLRIVAASGYNGPIGILDHRDTVDAEQSLSENLAGLKKVVANLNSATE